MATIAELKVKIGADLSEFNKKIGSMQKSLNNAGTKLRGVGQSMSMFITAPLVAAGVAALKTAADVQEMQDQFDIVFRNTAPQVSSALNEFALAAGRSRFELMGMAAELGDTLKPLGFTEQAAADLSVEMTQLATDLSSFKNLPMEEALRRLTGTLVGSHENALKFGVVINENTLKAEMLANGTDKLTGKEKELAKVQARINLLFKGTTDAQGNAIATSKSFTNQVRALSARFEDLAIDIGRRLMPVAEDLLDWVNKALRWWNDLEDGTKDLILQVAGLAAILGPLAVGIGVIMAVISPWTLAIAGVAAAVTLLVMNWDEILAWVNDKAPSVVKGFEAMWELIKFGFNAMVTYTKTVWGLIANAFGGFFEAMGNILDIGLAFITGDWSSAWNAIKKLFTDIWGRIVKAFNIAVKGILDVMPGFVKDWLGVTDEVSEGAGDIEKKLQDVAGEAVTTGEALSGTDGLRSDLENVTGAFGDVSTEAGEAEGSVKDFGTQAGKTAGDLTAPMGLVASVESISTMAVDSTGALVDMGTVPVEKLRKLNTELTTVGTTGNNMLGSIQGWFTTFDSEIEGMTDLMNGDIAGAIGNLANIAVPGLGTAFGLVNGIMGQLGLDMNTVFYGMASVAGTVAVSIGKAFGGVGSAIGSLFGGPEGRSFEENLSARFLSTGAVDSRAFLEQAYRRVQENPLTKTKLGLEQFIARFGPTIGFFPGAGTPSGGGSPISFDEFGNPMSGGTGVGNVSGGVSVAVDLFMDGDKVAEKVIVRIPDLLTSDTGG